MLSDLRYALRQFARFPGYACTIILTLGLGIGACTVIFTVVKSTLLEIVQGADFSRRVLIHETQPPARPQTPVSPPLYLTLCAETKSFEYFSAWVSTLVNLSGDGVAEPERLRGGYISPSTLAAWGTQPTLGRGFIDPEFQAGNDAVVLLSFGLWQRTFGGAADVLGRKILLDGNPYTIVGVLSEKFDHLGSKVDLCLPLVFNEAQRFRQWGGRYLQVTAELKKGVTLAQAQAELDVIAGRVAAAHPDTNRGAGLLVREFSSYLNRTLAPMLHVLLGTVLCVLLVACGNAANLLLARATARQQELSIRVALGAARARIIRQLLVESVLLSLGGGLVGIALAYGGIQFVRTFAPSAGTDFARLAYVELDGRMLAFTFVFSLATGVLFGLAPAWLTSRINLNEALKQGGRGTTEGRSRGRLRSAIAAIEIALTLLLLTGAGLLIRSFTQIARLDPGFTVEDSATMQLFLRQQAYGKVEQQLAFVDTLLARVRALPGVAAAAVATTLPTDAAAPASVSIVGQPTPAAGNSPLAVPNAVSPDYFHTLGIRLLHGRTFSDLDHPGAARVAIVNERFAQAYLPNENPIGRQIAFDGRTYEIVGVVTNTAQGELTAQPPQCYFPWRQFSGTRFTVVVRTAGDPSLVLGSLHSQVHAIDKNQPVWAVRSFAQLIGDNLARQRLMLNLLMTFAVLALVISAVGLYGVMAYSVGQRTTEFGVRMALGATPADVLRLVMRQGALILAAGLGLGLAAALAFGRLMSAYLFNTSAHDPVALVVTIVVLALTALVACFIPSYRATKVSPMVALRAE